MAGPVHLSCSCGQVRIEIDGAPIVSAECCCNSCRAAGEVFEALPGAGPVREPNGTTRYELFRKDRVRVVSGAAHMHEFRLKPDSHTRRVVAACCNTPLFTEFEKGHWLSMYGRLWPAGTLPPLDMRTMASDLLDASVLPDDVPNAKTQSGAFMWRLLIAWVAMGFRAPKVTVAGKLEV